VDYIPQQRGLRYLWYKNLSDNIVVEGPTGEITLKHCSKIAETVKRILGQSRKKSH
jgi:hypothetical protein